MARLRMNGLHVGPIIMKATLLLLFQVGISLWDRVEGWWDHIDYQQSGQQAL
jgi:hypothetical protein